MKKRYFYALLFGIPGLFVAGIISILLFGGLIGLLWIFVFGDNPWPSYIERLTAVFFVLAVLILWLVSIGLGYVIGRRLENQPGLSRTHILISGGLTLLFFLLILFQQWSVGNLSPNSDSVLCSEFCTQHGYPASGSPLQNAGGRMCSCFDEAGNETLRIPLDHLDPNFSK